MRKPDARQRGRAASMTAVMAVVFLIGGALAGFRGSSGVLAGGQEIEALRIDVTVDENSVSPDPLRIPAGRPVTLALRNAGRFASVFTAGRELAADHYFEHDLFADVYVNIEPVERADASEHGTVVEIQPGETVLMTFTLPESRRGEWMTGCFLPGHLAGGIQGTLTVE